MELDYFISGSFIDPIFVKDKWLDSSSSSIRGFTPLKELGLTGVSGNQDFSWFFTFDKFNNSPGNLLSNNEVLQNNGISIGYNSNNELFVRTFNTPYFSETISNLRLGKKNCLGIVKNHRNLTFYKYNLEGTGISQEQTVVFPVESNLNGGNYKVGTTTGTSFHLGLSGVSGLFDQAVLFNTALSKDQCNSIFSGFQPFTKVTNPYYTKVYSSSGIDRKSGSFFSLSDTHNIAAVFNSISNDIPNSIGNYVAEFSGFINNSTNFATWTGYYSLGNSLLCYSTGNLVGPIFGTGTYGPSSSSSFLFTDSVYSSFNSSGEKLVSHFITLQNAATGTLQDFYSYNLYEKYLSGVTTSLTLDQSYKTGFYMNGIITSLQSGISLLSIVSGDNFNQIGYEGIFDRVVGLFSVKDLTSSGHRVFWGESGKISGYLLNSGYIDILNTLETDIYPLFYDLGSGDVNFIHTTLLGYATGRYNPDTSIVFTGSNSWSDLFRVSKSDYWESSQYHLAHSKSSFYPEDISGIYQNSNNHWL